jgi:hypothetical protein
MAEHKPATGKSRAVHFHGPPRRLRLTAGQPGPVVSVKLPNTLHAYVDERHRVVRRGDDAARTHLRLRKDTPPGDYDITIERGDGTTETATLSVEPRTRLRITPSALHFAGAPGAKATAKLRIENRGNVAIEIPETVVTGIFDDDGIETALAAAYRSESDDLNEIVGTVFGRLREAHGGLLKMRIIEGAGLLAVGAWRSIVIEVLLGAKLHSGHGYHGTFELDGVTVALTVAVAQAPSERSKSK